MGRMRNTRGFHRSGQFGEAGAPNRLANCTQVIWNRDCFYFQVTCVTDHKGVLEMGYLEKEVIRMELQIGELIRIVANLNERLKELEDTKSRKSYIQQIPFDSHTR